MKLESVIEDAFLVKPSETLSHVASKMAERKIYEAFVFDTELRGIVTLDDIVKRRVSEPRKTRISYFMKPVTTFPNDTSVGDVINYMLVSEYKSLPIEREGKIYAVSKPKLLRFVKDEIFEGKRAKDIMHFPYCASEDDTLSTVISTMKDLGLNRIPILGKKGKFAGLVDSLSLAGVTIDESRAKRGERFGDKTKLMDIGINRFLRTDVMKVNPETDLKRIARMFSEGRICAVIVEKNGRFAGMVTVKDLFKLIGKSLETVYVRVTGLEGEDDFIKMKIDEMAENTIKKLLKLVTLTYVAIHVETHKTGGRRRKYSVKGRFVTEKGSFYASDHEWDPTKAMKLFLGKIEREVHKHIEKGRGY
ncbi:MAG: CBS domain-containing protein [Candidatus Aenigmatarchaeota archaeon]|nr:MAG: CBS domain-containing protein [Candidatus Aenigmarchaeota archaeon]